MTFGDPARIDERYTSFCVIGTCMCRRTLQSLHVESVELTTGNCSGKTRRVMDSGTELAERVRGLEAKLAEAHEAITLKDGELSRTYVLKSTRLEQKLVEHNVKLLERFRPWNSS